MRQHDLLLSILLLLCGVPLLVGKGASARDTDPLRSFYTATKFFSDFLPDSYDEILELTSAGTDVRVRVIRISGANRYCSGQLVRAAERVLPHTTVRKITGAIDLCSFTEQGVTAALTAAARGGVTTIEDSATVSIVAKCGAQDKVFRFPYPEQVDPQKLERENSIVNTLWDLSYKIRSRAFGKRFSFHDLLAAEEREREELGTKLLPELVSGKFDLGFDNHTCADHKCAPGYLASVLAGYTGPPANLEPATVELVNAPSLHLAKYDLPLFPLIAKQARIFGEVRLRIVPDGQTGLVREAQLISGNPLLGEQAIKAAKKWQFSPGTQAGQPVEAVLKFELCPGE